MVELEKIPTEQVNPNTKNIDSLDTLGVLRLMNDEDKKIAYAVESELESIARAVDCISAQLRKGGRLFYVGCGTSGRLGILDAVECPPTFSTDPEMVQGIIAGGNSAIFKAKEGAEDNEAEGRKDLENVGLTDKDVVVGIAASGRTPYVLGAMAYAREIGAPTVSVSCNKGGPVYNAADYPIAVDAGPEVITGSTRLKSGTAQKMVLNMLSTASMISLGKVYGNLMVDVKPSNEKLRRRAVRIVSTAAGVDEQRATEALAEAGGRAKTAIVMLLCSTGREEAERLLASADGRIARAVRENC